MKKTIILAGLLIAAMQASAAGGNSSLSLQKDKSTDLFTLNMRDSQGIRSFALVFPTDKLPYSGDLSECPKSRETNNIVINDPSDFKPLLRAVIVDCRGEETEFEISAPINGIAQVKKVEPPPAPAPAPAPTPAPKSSETGGQAPAKLKYPVKELGGCESAESCKVYCDDSANIDRCIAFAETNGLLTKGEIERGKKFSEIVKSGGGPGGCKSEESCKNYCNDIGKLDECSQFAEKSGLVSGSELEDMKKIQSVVKRGVKLPGSCSNRGACELYCKTPEHADECVAFAKEAGFISEEESKDMEKILPLMRSGQMPGGCSTKESCEAYCEDEGHFDECVAFAQKAGLVSDKDLEIMKKTGGKGPGGCHGRACQTFCENPANQEACFDFAKENGLISGEDLKRMDEGKKLLKEQLENGPPEVQECLKSVIGEKGLDSGGFVGGPELGEKMRACFEKMMPKEMMGQNGAGDKFEFGANGEFKGPGGCKSKDECEAFCKNNPKECGFEMPQGGQEGQRDERGPGLGGPGKQGAQCCVSPAPGLENNLPGCLKYCQENPESCRKAEEGYCRDNPENCPGGKFVPQCNFGEGGGGSGENRQPPKDFKQPCPAMPTVNECPGGQKKTQVFSSPECGDYYSCVPESSGSEAPAGNMPPANMMPPIPTNSDYQKQYEQQYQQRQYQPPANFSPPSY